MEYRVTGAKDHPSDFEQLVKLATIGASGCQANINNVNWPAVILYAQEQAVLPLLGCALLNAADIDCPDQLREQLLNITRLQSSTNLVRKQRILNLISELESQAFDVQILKGYAVGVNYAYPECRSSTDTDLLIPEKQEKKVCEFLSRKGFRINRRTLVSHHSVCQHSKLGRVEVHVHLYDDIVQDAWFQNINTRQLFQDPPVRIALLETSCSTLGYTDNLIFLTLHMIKHFINSGISLQMLLDIALYWSLNREKIDAERYWKLMEELRYTKVTSNILWIMIDTGCFQQKDFPGLGGRNSEAISLLITDLEEGGHMGIKEENRYFDWFEYSRLSLLRNKTPKQYRWYMMKHKIRAAYTQMFPSRDQLISLFPVLQQHKWLTPLCHIYRMFAYPIQKIRSGVLRDQIRTDNTHLPDEAKRRIKMFKSLGMI